MDNKFKKRFKRGIIVLFMGFIVLFVFAFLSEKDNDSVFFENNLGFVDDFKFSRSNYASKKYKINNSSNGGPINVDQKYEKIASIHTRSDDFEKEEKQLRNQIKDKNAIIQFEQNSGNSGNRKLQLFIGVQPEKFDSLYVILAKIGKVQRKEITKKDKTNEYRQLNAKKESLLKVRNSLIELKNKGGKIDEYINLENRILAIEEELQGLGVQLGNYDEENEFCTIKFSLNEFEKAEISLSGKIKRALSWTISTYFSILGILLLCSGFIYIVLLIIDKLELFKGMLKKMNE